MTEKPKLNDIEREMFAGALNIAVELTAAKHEQHRHLGSIVMGLCAIINKHVQVNDPKPTGEANGCACEPSGSDGLICPDKNGNPLCAR